jgi:hypothetical protein
MNALDSEISRAEQELVTGKYQVLQYLGDYRSTLI